MQRAKNDSSALPVAALLGRDYKDWPIESKGESIGNLKYGIASMMLSLEELQKKKEERDMAATIADFIASKSVPPLPPLSPSLTPYSLFLDRSSRSYVGLYRYQ